MTDGSWQEAAALFREQRDARAALAALGVDPDSTERVDALMRIQRALSQAEEQQDRDALEDLAYWTARGEAPETPRASFEEIVEAVETAYGPDVGELVDVPELAKALARSTPIPPVAAIVAILGSQAMQADDVEVLSVEPSNFGETVQYALPACPDCHGRVLIPCARCREAREALDGITQERVELMVREGMDRQELRQMLHLLQHCPQCGGRGGVPCACAREVAIPNQVRDGEFVLGERLADGEPIYCCLRLRGDR